MMNTEINDHLAGIHTAIGEMSSDIKTIKCDVAKIDTRFVSCEARLTKIENNWAKLGGIVVAISALWAIAWQVYVNIK